MTTPDIDITEVFPPMTGIGGIYYATRDGYEPGLPCGRGTTPEAATADLIEQEQDQ